MDASVLESVLVKGDLATLTADQKLSYYKTVCDRIGLNYLSQPFDYIKLNGKLVLYAKKAATDQLRAVKGVSLEITEEKQVGDLYIVKCKATLPDGRCDEDMGAGNIKGFAGEQLANQLLKITTKAKRRVTLSICGLGMLDELEVENIPAAEKPIELPPADMTKEEIVASIKQMASTMSNANRDLVLTRLQQNFEDYDNIKKLHTKVKTMKGN